MSAPKTTPAFPFGQPVLPRAASSVKSGLVYVLGAYPSGVHIRWIAPESEPLNRREVRALIVDNEPTPFWAGTNEEGFLAAWRSRVNWSPTWGEALAPPRGTNGPSGDWLDLHVLTPLGVSRAETCISDCLDTARLNAAQAARIRDTYAPVAAVFGLPACTVPLVPAGESGIVRETLDRHLTRLGEEIDCCAPELVVTLGNAAARVMATLADRLAKGAPQRLTVDAYGQPIQMVVRGHRVSWLPLVHPRSGERTPPWPEVHARWASSVRGPG